MTYQISSISTFLSTSQSMNLEHNSVCGSNLEADEEAHKAYEDQVALRTCSYPCLHVVSEAELENW